MLKPLSVLLFVLAAVPVSFALAGDFKLTTDAAGANGAIAQRFAFNGFGCTGRNLSPTVRWSGVPAGTKSLALTVYDPDAPTGSGWWHWVVIDIPASAGALTAGTGLPAGAHALRNDYGSRSWGGPCPPSGEAPHRYIFSLYALDVANLGLPVDASPAMAGFAIHLHTLGRAQTTLTYGR